MLKRNGFPVGEDNKKGICLLSPHAFLFQRQLNLCMYICIFFPREIRHPSYGIVERCWLPLHFSQLHTGIAACGSPSREDCEWQSPFSTTSSTRGGCTVQKRYSLAPPWFWGFISRGFIERIVMGGRDVKLYLNSRRWCVLLSNRPPASLLLRTQAVRIKQPDRLHPDCAISQTLIRRRSCGIINTWDGWRYSWFVKLEYKLQLKYF